MVGGTGAFRLGSDPLNADPANPFLSNRQVSLNGMTLSFLDGNGAGNAFVTFNATGDIIGLNNTAVGTNNIGFVGGTNTINGITNINTTTYNLTTIGNGTAVHQLEVIGVQDAIGTEALASPVWDVAVTGDVAASGMIKSGASLLLDGVTPGTRRLISDAALQISTISQVAVQAVL